MNTDFVEPMLAHKPKNGQAVEDFSSADWVMEEKFDGHRMIVKVVAGVSARAWSRVGNERVLPAHLVAALKKSLPTCTLDSEMYLPGGVSTDVTTTETLNKLEMVFFDLLKVGDASAMNEIGVERRKLLEEAVSKISGPLHLAEQYEPSEEKLKELWSRGGEGGVLKRKTTIYRPGARSRDWIKLKSGGSDRMKVTGFEAGLNGPYARITLVDAASGKHKASVKALNREWLRQFEKNPKKFIGQVLLIDFQMRTADGSYRHPMADRFEDDSLTPR